MAGRPASRGGGLTGLHYGLIAFVITTVLALVAFILQLTQNSGLQERADQAKQRSDDYGRPPAFYANEASARRGATVFGVMDDYLSDYGKLLTGNENAVYPEVEQIAQRTLAQAERTHEGQIARTDAILPALRRASSLLDEERRRSREYERELAAARTRIEDLTNQLDLIQTDFNEQVASLKEDYRATEQRYTSALNEKDRQREQLQANLERTTRELQDLRVTLEQGGEARDQQVQRLLTQIRDLRDRITAFEDPGLDPEALLTRADGRIIRSIPGSEYVYIDLGRDDGVQVGMTFEVFSRTDVPTGLRGKASIEVAYLKSDIAECRVMRTDAGHPIIEGDLVVNIAFERNRRPRFVIRGDFDLEYDGLPDTVEGREKLAAMIEKWGGEVVDDLNETSDFLIIGTAPFLPDVREGQIVTPTIMAQIEQRRAARSEYQDLVQQARELYVPVLTQSQFLFLMGRNMDEVLYP